MSRVRCLTSSLRPRSPSDPWERPQLIDKLVKRVLRCYAFVRPLIVAYVVCMAARLWFSIGSSISVIFMGAKGDDEAHQQYLVVALDRCSAFDYNSVAGEVHPYFLRVLNNSLWRR